MRSKNHKAKTQAEADHIVRVNVTVLIVNTAPAKPTCFDTDAIWYQWLSDAHATGVRIVRRVDLGNKRAGNRSTHYSILPIDQLDYCVDCMPERRREMVCAKRCRPSAASSPPDTRAIPAAKQLPVNQD